jgi:hypothetical protein
MSHDVLEIVRDLELEAVGLGPRTRRMQEGYFAA